MAAKSEQPNGIAEIGNIEPSASGTAASVDYSTFVAPAISAALFPRETETPIVLPTPKPTPKPTPSPAPRRRRQASGRLAIGNVLKALPGVAAVWALLFLVQPTERTQARLSVANAEHAEPPWSSKFHSLLALQPRERTKLARLVELQQAPPENPLIFQTARPSEVSERERVSSPPAVAMAVQPELRADFAAIDPALKTAEARFSDVAVAAFPPPLSSVAKPGRRRLTAKRTRTARLPTATARANVATLEIPDVLKPQ